jgi:hypothetical protein
MKRLSLMVSAAALLVATALAGLLTGCEVDSATESLTIQPSSAVMDFGSSREFTVSGGYETTWSLGTEGVGSLSTRKGNRTVFTAPLTGATNSTQTIHVDSTIQGVGGATSNNSPYSVSGDAYVTFK